MEAGRPASGDSSRAPVSGWNWRRWLLPSAVIFVCCSALVLWCNFRLHPGPNRPLVPVDREIIWITGPLKPNGDPDYVAWLDDRNSANLTTENNAAIDLLRITGPEPDGKLLPWEFFDRLEIDPLPVDGDYLVPLQDYLGDQRLVVAGRELTATDLAGLVADVVLPAHGFPAVDEWFAKHQHHLIAARQAAMKPGFHAPCCGPTVLDSPWNFTQQLGVVGRSLGQASLIRLSRGDVAGAIDDQLAIWRLGSHAGGQGFGPVWLSGVGNQIRALQAMKQTIHSGLCSPKDLARLARELDSLPAPLAVNQRLVDAERVLALDMALSVGRNGAASLSRRNDARNLASGSGGMSRGSVIRCDWATVFRELNHDYDQLDAIVAIADPRKKRAAALDNSAALERSARPAWEQVRLRFLGGLTGRGTLLADVLAGLAYPAIGQYCSAELRLAAQLGLIRTSVALERFRLEQGICPERLEQLVPRFLPAVPVDPFPGDPLIYRNTPEQPGLLYSVGPDLIDNGGVTEWDGSLKDSDLLARPTITTVEEWLDANRE